VDSFTGPPALQPDGLDQSFESVLRSEHHRNRRSTRAGGRSLTRTLSLGFSSGAPHLNTRVFVRPAIAPAALAISRTLDETGQRCPMSRFLKRGPVGLLTNRTDPVLAFVTLGQGPALIHGSSALPVGCRSWRQQILTTNQVAVVANPRLVARSTNAFAVTPIGGGQLTNNDRRPSA